MNRILKEIIDTAIAFLIALAIYKLLGIALATPVPIVSVTSNSMRPSLHPGDLALVVNASKLRVGEIVVYAADCPLLPREDVIHRVVEINGSMIVTKGDNNATNPVPDPCPVRVEQVKGKIVFAIPLLGYPRLLLNLLLGI